MAGRQGGVFTAAQAIAHGLSGQQVHRRVDAGRWHRVAGRGLTALDPLTGRPDGAGGWPPLVLAWAARVTWPDAVVGYRVAAALYGYPVSVGGQVEVEVLLPRRRRPYRGLVPHHVPYRRGDVAHFPGGLAVTSPTRTAVDCLATFDLDECWTLFAWLVTRNRLDRVQLTAHLERRTNRPGTGQLRALHAQTASGAVSPPECRLHQLLRTAGITGWTAGAPVHDANGLIGLVDLLFEEARVAVEIDGYGAHSSRSAFAADRRRQNRLVAAGYTVLRFTWWDIVGDPDHVVRVIRHALFGAAGSRP